MVSPSFLFTKPFWMGFTEQTVVGFVATFVATISLGWGSALQFAAMAAAIAGGKAVLSAASGIGPTGSPSLVDDRPSPQDMAAGQQLVREDQAARHRDDGIDVALDGVPREFRHGEPTKEL